MSIIDHSRLKKINNSLSIGDNALRETSLLSTARNYKKFVASRYRLYAEKDIQYIESDNIRVSKKIDGQLHFLYIDKDTCFLFNIKGRIIVGLPWLEPLKEKLNGYDHVLIAGELYCSNIQGERSRVYEVSKSIGISSTDHDTNKLSFAAFDVVQVEAESWRQKTFEEKEILLQNLGTESIGYHPVQWQTTDNKGLSKLFSQWVVEEGHEGLVCIDEANHTIYKIKPRHNVDAVILGYTESPDTPDNLRVLLVGLMRMDESLQVFAKVGTGFDDDQRREFYRLLTPLAVCSTFNIADRNHTLFTMVRPEIVIEMAFHDIIYENTSGRPEMKAVLNYDEAEGYTTKLAEPFVSVLGPVFKRIREDKEVNITDLRLTQLSEFVDLDNLEASSRDIDYAKSEILQREVYTKTTKGLVSIRKFVGWKTHKDDVDPDYPAYVFCFVDFSPGRKGPLKRTIRTATSESDLLEIYALFKESEIKRGWALAE